VMSELHNPSISWDNFKAFFLWHFRDVRLDQYHFTQLQMEEQGKSESPRGFAIRCRTLALHSVPPHRWPCISENVHWAGWTHTIRQFYCWVNRNTRLASQIPHAANSQWSCSDSNHSRTSGISRKHQQCVPKPPILRDM
jgi:hypothetical protein